MVDAVEEAVVMTVGSEVIHYLRSEA
jgi:hypothetical protein